MGFFDIFKKGKTADDFSSLPDMGHPAPLPPLPDPLQEMPGSGIDPPSFSSPERQGSSFQQNRSFDYPSNTTAPQKLEPSSYDKDMQIIIARLDAIRSELESMKQRIMHIERIAENSQDKQPMKRYGW